MPDLVSCIIPVFNHEKWVKQAIDSMIKQDYPNKRIVLIDDGSQDNSFGEILSILEEKRIIKADSEPEIMAGHISKVPVLACKFSKNYGPSIARNYGIKTAWEGSKYFAFVDSDDFYNEGKISKSIALMEENQLIGVVYSDYTTMNIHTGFKQRQFKEPFSYSRLIRECIVNNDSVISKKAFETVGLYEEDLRVCEDYSLWLRIAEKMMMVHIPEDLITIRVGKHSSTSTVSKETWEKCYSQVFERAKKRANGQT